MDIKYAAAATFSSAKELYDAAGKVKKKAILTGNAFLPIPVHGLDAQMGYARSKVPRFTLAGGVTGFFTGMLIVWFMNEFDYPLIVGVSHISVPSIPFRFFMN